MARKLYEFINAEMGGIKLMESEDGKELFMQGLFIQGDVQNQNGRVYPKGEIHCASCCKENNDETGLACEPIPKGTDGN